MKVYRRTVIEKKMSAKRKRVVSGGKGFVKGYRRGRGKYGVASPSKGKLYRMKSASPRMKSASPRAVCSVAGVVGGEGGVLEILVLGGCWRS